MEEKKKKMHILGTTPVLHFNRIFWQWAYTLTFEKHLLNHSADIIPTLLSKWMPLAAMTCIEMLLQDRGQ